MNCFKARAIDFFVVCHGSDRQTGIYPEGYGLF